MARPIRLKPRNPNAARLKRAAKPMRFTPQFLDELRARLPVSEVVGRRVKLQKAGPRVEGAVALQQGEDALVLRSTTRRGLVQISPPARTATSSTSSWRPKASASRKRSSGSRSMAGVPLPKVSHEDEAARRAAQDAARRHGACGEILRGDARRRAPAPRRAAISPTAASIRRRSSSSASAMRRPSASR